MSVIRAFTSQLTSNTTMADFRLY